MSHDELLVTLVTSAQQVADKAAGRLVALQHLQALQDEPDPLALAAQQQQQQVPHQAQPEQQQQQQVPMETDGADAGAAAAQPAAAAAPAGPDGGEGAGHTEEAGMEPAGELMCLILGILK